MQRRSWLKRSALGTAALLTLPTTQWAKPSEEVNAKREIRLNANENPYGPSKRVQRALQSLGPMGNRYPRALRKALKEKLADHFDLTPDWFFLGAGSAELLGLLGLYYGSQSGTVISPTPIFPLLPQYVARHGGDWRQVQMAAGGEILLSAIDQAIDHKTQLLYLCNPNNPTGWTFSTENLKQYCQAVPKHIDICLDEAYIEYTAAGESASLVKLVERNPNLIICRTFSKIYGLAGMRIGYMVAHPDKIKEFRDYHTGFEITASAYALQAAIVALDDQEFVKESRRKNQEAFTDMMEICKRLQLPYIPSQANHLAFNPTSLNVPFFTQMEQASIRLGRFQYQGEDWCRLTMGTKAEMRAFQEELQALTDKE